MSSLYRAEEGPENWKASKTSSYTEEGEVHALGAFKIVAYDIEGIFVHETDFNFWIYNFTYDSASETYIEYPANALNRGLNNEHTAKTLLYLNRDGTITNSYFPIPFGREEIGYMATHNLPGFKSHQLFNSHLVDTVYTVGPYGMAPRYRLDYGRHSITEEVFERRKNYASKQNTN